MASLSKWFQSLGIQPGIAIDYTAAGGGRVEVPKYIWPHSELHVAVSASRGEIKDAFRRAATQASRQHRAMASLSYHILTSTISRYDDKGGGCFEIGDRAISDVFVLAAAGDTKRLLCEISRNKALLKSADEHGRTLLYLTARSGFYDTTEALLKEGAPVNEKQVDGSTPLHGASFYCQRLIVELLLKYGADPGIKNKWGNTALDEASGELKAVISACKTDGISKIVTSLISSNLVHKTRFIEYKGKVVAREVQRNSDLLDSSTKNRWNYIQASWHLAWHGTKAKYLSSILRNGLMPSGTRLSDGSSIEPPDNHYKLGETRFGIYDWARAVFLSPSILYASHACYSERVFSNSSEQWCIVIKAYVKPASYTEHDPTVFKYEPIDGEPDQPEYRIDVKGNDKVLRVESARNVVVFSLLFISLDILENSSITYAELLSLFN